MNCPWCGGEMTAGYVQGSRMFYFTTKKRMVAFVPGPGDLRLPAPHWSIASCDADYCPACEKVVIDYAKTEEGKMKPAAE